MQLCSGVEGPLIAIVTGHLVTGGRKEPSQYSDFGSGGSSGQG